MEPERSTVGRIVVGLLQVTFALASTTFGLVFVGAAVYALYTWILPAWRKALTNPSPETSIGAHASIQSGTPMMIASAATDTHAGVRVGGLGAGRRMSQRSRHGR